MWNPRLHNRVLFWQAGRLRRLGNNSIVSFTDPVWIWISRKPLLMNETIILESTAILFCIFFIRIMRVRINQMAIRITFKKPFFIHFSAGLFSSRNERSAERNEDYRRSRFWIGLESKCHRNVLEQSHMNFKYFLISFCLHFLLFTFLLRRRILTRRIISALLWGDSFQWGFPSQPVDTDRDGIMLNSIEKIRTDG